MARRRDPGYNEHELQQFNDSYRESQQPYDYQRINIDLPGTPDIPAKHRKSTRNHYDDDSDASSYHSDSHVDNYYRQRTDHRKQSEILETLPSRQLDKAISGSVSRKSRSGYNTQRKKSRRANAIPHYGGTLRYRHKGDDSAQAILNQWTVEDDELDGDDELLDEDLRRQKELKSLTMNLHNKKALKKELRKMTTKKSQAKISSFKQFRYATSIRWIHFKAKMRDIAYDLRFWHGHLKTIEGHFGTGVTSYFKFLKWLFLLNIPAFFFLMGFLVVPQLLWRFNAQVESGYSNTTFTGKELLTGGGWFEETEMYYGNYTNQAIAITSNLSYDMPWAYLCTTGGLFLLCLIIIGHSLANSYRKNFIEGSDEFNIIYVEKVFSGWDFGIMSPSSAKLKHKSIFKELQEFLANYHTDQKRRDCVELTGWYVFRIATNLLVIGLIAGSAYLIFYISTTQSLRTDIDVIAELAMPLCVTAINLLLPFAFSIVASFESYEKPKTELYITMTRTVLLKFSTLAVLIYFWFNTVQCPGVEEDKTADLGTCKACWETFMGEQIYMLMIVDFVFIILLSLIVEFFRRAVSQFCIKKLGHPEFNIGSNTLNLIYSQTLCWIGTFYSPMLIVVNIVKLFAIFYLKRVSATLNCVPSSRPWRAARTHTIFLLFTLMAFLLCATTIGCSIVFVRPSEGCGPFQGLNTSYTIVTDLIEVLREDANNSAWFSYIIDLISSAGFIAGLLAFFVVLVFYMSILSKAKKQMVKLLKHQIHMEGKDKVFLLKMLQDVNKSKKDNLDGEGKTTRNVFSTSDDPDSNGPLSPKSPGGRTFAKLEVHFGTEHHLLSPEKLKKHRENANTGKENVGQTQEEPPKRNQGTPLAQRKEMKKDYRDSPTGTPAMLRSPLTENGNQYANPGVPRQRRDPRDGPSDPRLVQTAYFGADNPTFQFDSGHVSAIESANHAQRDYYANGHNNYGNGQMNNQMHGNRQRRY